MNIFNQIRERRELRRKLDTSEESYESLMVQHKQVLSQNNQLRQDLDSARSSYYKVSKKLSKTETKLREQNEADLLLVSERIHQRILKGEKVKPTDQDIALQKQLYAQHLAYQQSPYTPSYPGYYPGNPLSAMFGQ